MAGIIVVLMIVLVYLFLDWKIDALGATQGCEWIKDGLNSHWSCPEVVP
jgi:hypothetical protein